MSVIRLGSLTVTYINIYSSVTFCLHLIDYVCNLNSLYESDIGKL